MIKKAIQRRDLHDPDAQSHDLHYWLSRPASERIEAVDLLRKQHLGHSDRLQRSARVVKRT